MSSASAGFAVDLRELDWNDDEVLEARCRSRHRSSAGRGSRGRLRHRRARDSQAGSASSSPATQSQGFEPDLDTRDSSAGATPRLELTGEVDFGEFPGHQRQRRRSRRSRPWRLAASLNGNDEERAGQRSKRLASRRPSRQPPARASLQPGDRGKSGAAARKRGLMEPERKRVDPVSARRRSLDRRDRSPAGARPKRRSSSSAPAPGGGVRRPPIGLIILVSGLAWNELILRESLLQVAERGGGGPGRWGLRRGRGGAWAGIDPILVRVAFGLVVGVAPPGSHWSGYAIAWALIPARARDRPAATSAGSPPAHSPARKKPASRTAGAETAEGRGRHRAAHAGGCCWFSRARAWWRDALVWPLVLAAVGGTLLWSLSRRTAAPASARPARGRRRAGRAGRARGGAGLYRGGFGVALVVGAGLLFLWANGALGAAGDASWRRGRDRRARPRPRAFLWRLARNLAAERAERIRSQERAELAAHLHDSVLQTLALMQKRADDPRDGRAARPPAGARAARVAVRGPGRGRRRAAWPPRSRGRRRGRGGARRADRGGPVGDCRARRAGRGAGGSGARGAHQRRQVRRRGRAGRASTPRSRTIASRSSSAIAEPGSISSAVPEDRRGCGSRSSGAWSATAARRGATRARRRHRGRADADGGEER